MLSQLLSRLRLRPDGVVDGSAISNAGSAEDQLMASFEQCQLKLLRHANRCGLSRSTILQLARRLEPDVVSLDQAIIELVRSVEVAVNITTNRKRDHSEDAFVSRVLIDVAEKTRRGNLDGGTLAIVDALAQTDHPENAKDETVRRQRIVLYDAGIKQHTLRRDAGAVAEQFERLVATEYGTEHPAWHPSFRAKYDEYLADSEVNGINFSLDVAVECARRILDAARDPDERGTAAFLLGNALAMRGQRDGTTERLQDAVVAYRDALKEWDREDTQRQREATQARLNATQALLDEMERTLPAEHG